MSTIAATSTAVYPAQPLFIPCNGPFLGLDGMPIRIKEPPVSDDEGDHSVHCSFDNNYDGSVIEQRLKEEDAAGGRNDSYRSGTKCDSNLLTTGLKIKEEPGMDSQIPLRFVTYPTTGQQRKMYVGVKKETELNITNKVLTVQHGAGSLPCNMENNEPQATKAKKRKDKSSSIAKTRSILPKTIINSNTEVVELHESNLHTTNKRLGNTEAMDNQPAKKKRMKYLSSVRYKSPPRIPATDASSGGTEMAQENLRNVCPYCHNVYSSERVMDVHFRKYHRNHYRCKRCRYIYESQDILDEHSKLHEKNATPYQCTSCKMKYKHRWGLEQHQIRAHSTVEPKANDDHQANGSRLRIKSFACQYCANVYPLLTHLRAHERIIHGVKYKRPKEFKCDVCDKCFCIEDNFRRHVELHERVYTCDDCGKVFRDKYILKMHVRIHTGEKPYKCSVCCSRFSRLTSLQVHKLTHTGVRPYVCNICGRSFTQRGTLRIHHRKHPGNHPLPPPVSLATLATIQD